MTKHKHFTIIDAIQHKQVFGRLPAFASLDSWQSWLVWLKAIHALPMTDIELEIFRECTSRQSPPMKPPAECYTIVGRRGGKSFMTALTAVYLGCFGDYKRHLNAGERASILVLAVDRAQTKVVFNYIKGIIDGIPALRQMVVAERADELELDNSVVIATKTSDYRGIRGLSIACVIADEVSFWPDQGVNPDTEIFRALKPAMLTIPDSKLLCISTPYARSGVLFDAHRSYFAQDNDRALVWVAPSTVMNPCLNQEQIDRDIAADPSAARSEWLAEFRDDLEAAFSLEALEACVIRGRDELPAAPTVAYCGFVDLVADAKTHLQ